MKRFYIDMQEVTKEEADKQIELNNMYLNSSNMSDWEKARFIVIIDDDKTGLRV